MSDFITFMAKQDLNNTFEPLVEVRINRLQVLSLRQLPSVTVHIGKFGSERIFQSPIVELRVPGDLFFVSGTMDEVEARLR
jgi:hypothetical protein